VTKRLKTRIRLWTDRTWFSCVSLCSQKDGSSTFFDARSWPRKKKVGEGVTVWYLNSIVIKADNPASVVHVVRGVVRCHSWAQHPRHVWVRRRVNVACTQLSVQRRQLAQIYTFTCTQLTNVWLCALSWLNRLK